jgi:hypothetical protein
MFNRSLNFFSAPPRLRANHIFFLFARRRGDAEDFGA